MGHAVLQAGLRNWPWAPVVHHRPCRGTGLLGPGASEGSFWKLLQLSCPCSVSLLFTPTSSEALRLDPGQRKALGAEAPGMVTGPTAGTPGPRVQTEIPFCARTLEGPGHTDIQQDPAQTSWAARSAAADGTERGHRGLARLREHLTRGRQTLSDNAESANKTCRETRKTARHTTPCSSEASGQAVWAVAGRGTFQNTPCSSPPCSLPFTRAQSPPGGLGPSIGVRRCSVPAAAPGGTKATGSPQPP